MQEAGWHQWITEFWSNWQTHYRLFHRLMDQSSKHTNKLLPCGTERIMWRVVHSQHSRCAVFISLQRWVQSTINLFSGLWPRWSHVTIINKLICVCDRMYSPSACWSIDVTFVWFRLLSSHLWNALVPVWAPFLCLCSQTHSFQSEPLCLYDLK